MKFCTCKTWVQTLRENFGAFVGALRKDPAEVCDTWILDPFAFPFYLYEMPELENKNVGAISCCRGATVPPWLVFVIGDSSWLHGS